MRGDFFVCASDKQRDLWLGFLAALGRVNPAHLRGRPHLAPSDRRRALRAARRSSRAHAAGAARRGAGHRARRRRRDLGRGALRLVRPARPSSAPSTSVRAARPRVRLFFLGMRHPKPDIEESPRWPLEARRLADALGLTGTHVFFNDGWVPYHDRQNYAPGGRRRREPPPRAPGDHVLVPDPHARLPVGGAAHRGHRRRRLRRPHRRRRASAPWSLPTTSTPWRRPRRPARRPRAPAAMSGSGRSRWRNGSGGRWRLEPLVAFCAAPRPAADTPHWPGPRQPPHRVRRTAPDPGRARRRAPGGIEAIVQDFGVAPVVPPRGVRGRWPPTRAMDSRPAGPAIKVQSEPVDRRSSTGRWPRDNVSATRRGIAARRLCRTPGHQPGALSRGGWWGGRAAVRRGRRRRWPWSPRPRTRRPRPRSPPHGCRSP